MSAKKNSNAYAELNDLYDRSMGMVTELEQTVSTYREQGAAIVKDPAAVEEIVKTIESDIVTYKDALNKIHDEHKDWKGRPKRPNQYIECHSIGNDYFNIVNSIVSATMPLATDVIIAITEGTES